MGWGRAWKKVSYLRENGILTSRFTCTCQIIYHELIPFKGPISRSSEVGSKYMYLQIKICEPLLSNAGVKDISSL